MSENTEALKEYGIPRSGRAEFSGVLFQIKILASGKRSVMKAVRAIKQRLGQPLVVHVHNYTSS